MEYLSPDFYIPYLLDGLRVIFILLFAYLATLAIRRAIRAVHKYSVRAMMRAGDLPAYELEKRAETISGVVRKALLIVIWTVAIMMALDRLGFRIGPLLASVGVAGIAIGFGAQSLVKDILNGLFMQLENQIRVNDVAVINGTGGLVEEINLRTTVLRGENGAVHIFPNGNIQTLSNLTRDYSYCVLEIGVGYGEDTDVVTEELKRIAAALTEDDPYKQMILAPLEVLGVDKLGDSSVIVKAKIKTLPGKQFGVYREMQRRIKKRFGEAGIEIPFPTRDVHVTQELSPGLRAELKEIVREVLTEKGTSAS